MKGLVLKELYVMFKRYWAVLLVCGVAMFVINYPFANFLLCFFISLIPKGLAQYEKQNSISAFTLTLPCSKAQAVGAKYLLGIFLAVITMLLYFSSQLFRAIKADSVNYIEIVDWLLTPLIICLITISFTLRGVFRREKKWFEDDTDYFVEMILFIFIISHLFDYFERDVSKLKPFDLFAMIIVFAICVYGYSRQWRKSIKNYEEHDF